MLSELTISNFAIIDNLRLKFHPGFNVMTGETGAGKSIVIDAVTLLLGGRATTDFIRTGADAAYIEGIFQLSPELQQRIAPILEREGLEDDPGIVLLAREIRASGRSFGRVNGRTVSVTVLEEVAAPLVDIHGQHHHLSLLQVKEHRAFLDRYAGLGPLRRQVAQEFRRLQEIRRELKTLRESAQQIARRMDQLTFQVEEIDTASLQPGEEDELMVERNRLANAEKLSQIAGETYRLLVDTGDELPSASDLVNQVIHQLTNLQRVDESVTRMMELAENIGYQVEDLCGQLQSYADEVEFNPSRLQQVEERLSLVYNLKRKYGNSIEEILAFGQRAKAELESISHTEDRIEALQVEAEKLRRSLGELAAQLSDKRREAGERLAEGVEQELQELGMAQTKFMVDLAHAPHPDGVYVGEETFACDETGIDQIEFLISPNPGEPLKPMAKIASGGETSRLMLALKTVLALADETPTLIFDEIDQGIGGRIGGVVGRKLWGLADKTSHQVLCITHLAQIAAYGDTHYQVAKRIEDQRTTTHIDLLDEESQLTELAQMMGGLSEATRLSATELIEDSRNHKTAGSGVMKQAALI